MASSLFCSDVNRGIFLIGSKVISGASSPDFRRPFGLVKNLDGVLVPGASQKWLLPLPVCSLRGRAEGSGGTTAHKTWS